MILCNHVIRCNLLHSTGSMMKSFQLSLDLSWHQKAATDGNQQPRPLVQQRHHSCVRFISKHIAQGRTSPDSQNRCVAHHRTVPSALAVASDCKQYKLSGPILMPLGRLAFCFFCFLFPSSLLLALLFVFFFNPSVNVWRDIKFDTAGAI